tara:strand:- start:110 stop:409 length:300 start_codon:yes stop_codon:yes gene_type:complete
MNSLPIPPTPRIPSVNAIPEEDEQLEGRWTPRLEADDGGEDDGGDGAIFYYEEKIIGFLSLEIIIFIGRESKKYETKKNTRDRQTLDKKYHYHHYYHHS